MLDGLRVSSLTANFYVPENKRFNNVFAKTGQNDERLSVCVKMLSGVENTSNFRLLAV